ncbi:hypothetical protein [Streptomyces sp. NPDC017260]|uniref:hypothetical protein n=1 Tax=unclassified Streptomyces TaxID=2593676 RepID=UPI00379B79DE
MRQQILLFCAVLFIVAGAALMMTAAMEVPARAPEPQPAPQTAPGAPAWAHRCLGTDDEPAHCP